MQAINIAQKWQCLSYYHMFLNKQCRPEVMSAGGSSLIGQRISGQQGERLLLTPDVSQSP